MTVIGIAGISARCLVELSSSTVVVTGSYFREQSSPLYTVDTAGKAIEVGYSTAGRAVMVNRDQLWVEQQ